jgi:hypothetical protein
MTVNSGVQDERRYGIGLLFVPVQSAVVPFASVVPGGQTKTPPAGPMTPPTEAAGVHPFPSDAASNSATRCFVPRLPNIVIVTQFWLGRGPIVPEPEGARMLLLPGPVMTVGKPLTGRVVTE